MYYKFMNGFFRLFNKQKLRIYEFSKNFVKIATNTSLWTFSYGVALHFT